MPISADLSLSEHAVVPCPLCGAGIAARRWRVIDARHRPDLLVHAVDGSVQRSYCATCIGPGVERPGSFAIVASVDGAVQSQTFLVGDVDSLAAESALVDRHLRAQFDRHGIDPATVEAAGSWLVERSRDVADALDRTWPALSVLFDPVMLAGPLGVLLGAARPADQAAAVAAAPDLARPNIEQVLSLMAGADDGEGAAAARALRFIVNARRTGLAAAVRTAAAEQRRHGRARSLPKVLADRVLAFVNSTHADVPPAAVHDTAAVLCRDLAAGGAALDAEVWAHAGALLRARADASSMPWAVRAYERARAAVDSADTALAHGILLGLATACDLRRDGDRHAHVEQALACAAAARELAAALPVEAQVDAARELGTLYLHRPTGDPVSNLLLAREALTFAHDAALTAAQRMLARYNLALVDIEDGADDRLAAGIARLESLAAPEVCTAVFDPLQRQNLFQSLGVALAQRATGGGRSRPADLDRAAHYVEQALDLARSREAEHDTARLAGLLASMETDRRTRGGGTRDLAGILALLDEAGRTLRPDTAPADYARNELRRAAALEALGDPVFARQLVAQAYRRACAYLSPEGAPDLCRRAQSQLGNLRFEDGDFPAAAGAFAVACAASEHVYHDRESVSGRAEEVTPNARLYEGLVDSLSRTDDGPDTVWRVLEAMEAGRARLTLDLMGLRPLPAFPDIPPELIQEEARLIAELGWSLPGAGPNRAPDDPDRLRRQRATQQALRALWERIAACGENGLRYAGLRTSRPPGRTAMAAVASDLGPRAAILSFFVLQDRVLAAWLRSGEPPRLYAAPITAAALREEWFTTFRRDVLDASDTDTPAHRWLALGDALFGPIAGELGGLDLLVVVPHGDLHALPLHALSVGGQPLIARVPVVYVPSIGVLASIAAGPGRRGRGAALVASHAVSPEEAESFEGEADDVARRLGTTARHHATGAAVVAAAPASAIIHLVCHGAFDAGDPLESGVLLADGVLAARDWLPLPLRSDLVVLSGCETGRQQVQAGDELNGLARTLLQAGAASVLLTLWRVYSGSTAAWMTLFYERLGAASPLERARAFQYATLRLRDADPDPVAWAAFALMGRAGE